MGHCQWNSSSPIRGIYCCSYWEITNRPICIQRIVDITVLFISVQNYRKTDWSFICPNKRLTSCVRENRDGYRPRAKSKIVLCSDWAAEHWRGRCSCIQPTRRVRIQPQWHFAGCGPHDEKGFSRLLTPSGPMNLTHRGTEVQHATSLGLAQNPVFQLCTFQFILHQRTMTIFPIRWMPCNFYGIGFSRNVHILRWSVWCCGKTHAQQNRKKMSHSSHMITGCCNLSVFGSSQMFTTSVALII